MKPRVRILGTGLRAVTDSRQPTKSAGRFLSRALLGCLSVLVVACAGCGLTPKQQAAIGAFSGATREMSAGMAENFIRTRDEVVSLRKEMLELRSGSVRLNNPAADLDGPLDVKELDRRLRAAAVLTDYALLLSALAEDTQTPRMIAASDQFISSLRQIEGVQLSEAKADAIAALVAKVGGLLIDYKRKTAVKSVVLGARPSLMKVADLVEQDFDPQKLLWVRALAETHFSITNTLAKQMDELAAGERVDETSPNRAKWTEAAIAIQREKYDSLAIRSAASLDATTQICERMKDTLARFRKANEELCGLVQAPDFDLGHLDDYLTQVQEMVRLAKILSNDERK